MYENSIKRIPFNSSQEKILTEASWFMIASGGISIVSSIVALGQATPEMLCILIVAAALAAVLPAVIMVAGFDLKRAVDTDQADQQHIVDAFARLRLVFMVKGVCVLFLGGMFILAIIFRL
ncbi:MAG: hypothetical protein AAFS10_18185, partial [Myxococcota bacterium]